MFQIKKGHYGYLKRRKKQLLCYAGVIFFGMIILLVMGFLSTGTRKNLLTVAAVISALPLANQLVVLIAVWKFKSRPLQEYEQVKEITGKGLLNTELIVTSKTDKALEINYAYIHEKGVFCYSQNLTIDRKKAEEYIKGYMKSNSLQAEVFFIKDWKQYLNRLSSLEPEDRADCSEELLKIEGVLRAIAI